MRVQTFRSYTMSSKKKEKGGKKPLCRFYSLLGDVPNPLLRLTKASVLQDCRIFNSPNISTTRLLSEINKLFIVINRVRSISFFKSPDPSMKSSIFRVRSSPNKKQQMCSSHWQNTLEQKTWDGCGVNIITHNCWVWYPPRPLSLYPHLASRSRGSSDEPFTLVCLNLRHLLRTFSWPHSPLPRMLLTLNCPRLVVFCGVSWGNYFQRQDLSCDYSFALGGGGIFQIICTLFKVATLLPQIPLIRKYSLLKEYSFRSLPHRDLCRNYAPLPCVPSSESLV